MSLRTFDLRVWLPLLMALIICVLFGMWIVLEYRHQTRRLETAYLEQWQRALNFLQQDVERELREENLANIEEVLTHYNIDPKLNALALIVDADRILLANRLGWKTRKAGETLPGFDPLLPGQVIKNNRGILKQDSRHHLQGYFPVLLPTTHHRLRDGPKGILYLDYDLGDISNEVWGDLAQDIQIILLLAAAAIVLLLVLQYRFVIRPLQLLTTGSGALAEGRFDPIPITGQGDLARLAQSFNTMAQRLQHNLNQLHDREQRLSRTLESIGDAVITTDHEGRVTRLNPVAEKLTGWSESEARGCPVENVFPIINARSRKTVTNPVNQALQSGKVIELSNDTTLLSRDGHEYQIADSAAPIFAPDGHTEGAILVFHDVTEAYRLREELRIAAIAFDTHEALMICDSRGDILRVNPAFTTLTGYPAEAVIGKNPRLLKSGRHDPPFYRNMWSRLQHEGRWIGRIINHDLQGNELHCWQTIAAVRDNEGTISHFVASLTDLTELEQTTHALLESQSKYQSLLSALHDGMFLMQDGIIVDCNEKMLVMYGYSRDEFIGKTPAALSPPVQPDGTDSVEAVTNIINKVLAGQSQVFEWVCTHKDGSPIIVEASLSLAHVDNKPTLIGTVRDIRVRKQAETERQQLLDELSNKEELLRLATRASGVGIWEWDIASDQVIWTDEVAALFGIEPAGFDGTLDAYKKFIHPDDLERVENTIRASLEKDPAYHIQHRVIWPDGSIRWIEGQGQAERDADGTPLRMLGTVIDITERKTAQDEIERLAYYDSLTGMANRRLLLDRLRQANAHALREQTNGALLYIDLDRFKILNDSLGHHAGDILLQRVASRLIALLRKEDTVARLGGDEFVVMLPSLAGDATETARLAHRIADKIRSALSGGYDLEGHAFHISASIGIALFPPDGRNAEELLNHADAAMYQAKSNGRDTIAFYHASLQEDADKRLAIEEELRHAIQKEQLCLHYQPQLDTRGKTIAAEALLRWQHPQRGMIMPNEFIHIAEESGLILEIGEWVLLSACQQLFDWSQHTEFHAPTVSVNVSPIQFRHADFASQVERIIRRCKVEPQRLTLEITEGMLIEDLADTSRKLETLKQLGVRISIDDFGTGYSSLYYLKHLPLDELKIDRNYVQDIVQDTDDAIIVETILAMARHLGLDVVAEGVETETQARFLREHGCQQFQGFLYARPEPAATFGAKFLKRD